MNWENSFNEKNIKERNFEVYMNNKKRCENLKDANIVYTLK